jgi:DNA-binding CsgD family transcriptional regulator
VGRPARYGAPLSPGERAVVAQLCLGLSRAQIAARLGVRPETVKTQLGAIYRKLNLPGRHAVAAWAATEPDGRGAA